MELGRCHMDASMIVGHRRILEGHDRLTIIFCKLFDVEVVFFCIRCYNGEEV